MRTCNGQHVLSPCSNICVMYTHLSYTSLVGIHVHKSYNHEEASITVYVVPTGIVTRLSKRMCTSIGKDVGVS